MSEYSFEEIVQALLGNHPTLSAGDVLSAALRLPEDDYKALLETLDIVQKESMHFVEGES